LQSKALRTSMITVAPWYMTICASPTRPTHSIGQGRNPIQRPT
jgi:hypothetical protein